jgi:hypothetical protein
VRSRRRDLATRVHRSTALETTRLACALAAAALGMTSLAAVADVPAPQDVPYQGTLKISVDATDLAHRIFRVHEVVPGRRAR